MWLFAIITFMISFKPPQAIQLQSALIMPTRVF